MYCISLVLFCLCGYCTVICLSALRPVTPPDDQDDCEQGRDKTTAKKTSVAGLLGYCTEMRRMHHAVPERTITVANPDLLMKLFDVVHTGHKTTASLTGQSRRGRSVVCLLCSPTSSTHEIA